MKLLLPTVLLFVNFSLFSQLTTFELLYSKSSRFKEDKKIKKLHIKVDGENDVYLKNKLIYKSSNHNAFTHYEILGNKFILISCFNIDTFRYVSAWYTYWLKDSVYIIPLKEPEKKYCVVIRNRCSSNGVIEFNESKRLLYINSRNDNKVVALEAKLE